MTLAPDAAPGHGPTNDTIRTTVVPGYGLTEPTVEQVRTALAKVRPAGFEAAWSELLVTSGIHDGEQNRQSLERLLTAMAHSAHIVTAMSARAQAVRLAAFDQLSTGRKCGGSAQP